MVPTRSIIDASQFFFCFTHLLIHCDLALCKEILWNNSFLITTLREASC